MECPSIESGPFCVVATIPCINEPSQSGLRCPTDEFSYISCFLGVHWFPAQQQLPHPFWNAQRFVIDIERHDGSYGRHDKLRLHPDPRTTCVSVPRLVPDPNPVTTLQCFLSVRNSCHLRKAVHRRISRDKKCCTGGQVLHLQTEGSNACKVNPVPFKQNSVFYVFTAEALARFISCCCHRQG